MSGANVKITDVVKPFDGNGDITEWLNKFQLIVKLRSINNEATILPMFLEGSALSVYLELSDTVKADAASLKNALRDAFSVNPFRAYEEFSRRVWQDEPVDVFMSELRRLARTADITSDRVLLRAFVVGLPSTVSRELRATNGIETMDLSRVVERARALMSELMNVHVTAAAVGKTGNDESKHRENSSRGNGRQERAGQTDKRSCYGCGGPHLVRNCPDKRTAVRKCWTCGGGGHISPKCPSNQGNSHGGTSAPEVPQED